MPEELRKAYLKRLPFVHPDKGGDEADFLLLQRAYDELSDPDSRARHDAALAAHLRKDQPPSEDSQPPAAHSRP